MYKDIQATPVFPLAPTGPLAPGFPVVPSWPWVPRSPRGPGKPCIFMKKCVWGSVLCACMFKCLCVSCIAYVFVQVSCVNVCVRERGMCIIMDCSSVMCVCVRHTDCNHADVVCKCDCICITYTCLLCVYAYTHVRVCFTCAYIMLCVYFSIGCIVHEKITNKKLETHVCARNRHA
jgi:hypothetical protein